VADSTLRFLWIKETVRQTDPSATAAENDAMGVVLMRAVVRSKIEAVAVDTVE
jgi:hypothetical protein